MKREFLIERQGKVFALYAGLLDEAHQHGLSGITTALVQIPTPENGNMAICQAVVTMDVWDDEHTQAWRQREYSGLGDANPANAGKIAGNALIRMAETRAKARALRDAVNAGAACVDELPDDDHETPDPPTDRPRQPQQGPRPNLAPAAAAGPPTPNAKAGPAPTLDLAGPKGIAISLVIPWLKAAGFNQPEIVEHIRNLTTAKEDADAIGLLQSLCADVIAGLVKPQKSSK
jgi:hypothetical protein